MTDEVLVTGGCGFIGANLVRRLLEIGYGVRVFDDLRTGRKDYLDGLETDLWIGDINDTDSVARAARGVSAIVHLAAAGSVVDSVTDPAANFTANVHGTFSVLRAACASDVGKVVCASTGGALIGNATPPVDERSLPKPISPYGASKLAGEAYAHAFACSYGLSTISLRFANVYGPFSGHKKGAITVFLKALHDGQPIVIYGDGDASRDFMYVDDICAGIERGLSTELPGGTVLHLATGVETTVRQLARVCCDVAGAPDHPIEYRSRRAGEVERNFATFDLARQRIGFLPRVTLADGLRATWEWYRANVFSRA